MCSNQIEKRRKAQVPLLERPDIIEMNKEENLTDGDKEMNAIPKMELQVILIIH